MNAYPRLPDEPACCEPVSAEQHDPDDERHHHDSDHRYDLDAVLAEADIDPMAVRR